MEQKSKPPSNPNERISPGSSYPLVGDLDLMPDENGGIPPDLLDLESEGRALVLDLGKFVLINTYCPNETSDERLPFKINYHRMLEERTSRLISEGREVIVVGDINVCAAPLDYVEGDIGDNAKDFWNHPARAWFKKWLAPEGPMNDVVRSHWPERKGMFTCPPFLAFRMLANVVTKVGTQEFLPETRTMGRGSTTFC